MPGLDVKKSNCSQVPSLVSAFVDTFVDYTVGGQFLGPSLHNNGSGKSSTSYLEESSPTSPEVIFAGPNQSTRQEDGSIPLVTSLPAAERLVAIGDIHGDLGKAKQALRIAEVMDENNKWIGGKTVVVQVGDLLDRGGDEIKVMYFLEKLKAEARKDGGDVHIMNGNHEIMNMEADFRCATPAGMKEFQQWAQWHKMGNVLKEQCEGLKKPYDWFKGIPENLSEGFRSRIAALRPGGPLSSRFLASHPTVLVVGGTVFVHGGLLPKHVAHGLERINEETREWMQGRNGFWGPTYLHGRNALVWVRKYSNENENSCDCDVLEKALSGVAGAKRMVMGHTIQQVGINAVCSNKAVRVDVGLSKGCGNGPPQVLEIRGDKSMKVLSAQSTSKLDMDDMSAYRNQNQGLASLLSRERSPEVQVSV